MEVLVVPELQRKSTELPVAPSDGKVVPPHRPMTRDFQIRFVAVVLALITVAAGVFGWINYQKERHFETPYDGVWWVEHDGHLKAQRVEPTGPGARAGIKVGDVLRSIGDHEVTSFAAVTQQMYRTGVWSKANYGLVRNGVPVSVPVILVPFDRSLNAGLRFIALIYLGIGLYVLLRRWTAPKSTHFYLFCLVSYIFYAFHYTGKLNQFDWIIYWSNVVAEAVQPALFLHFVLTFPEVKGEVKRRPWLLAACYVPGALVVAAYVVAQRWLAASEVLRYNLDRLEMLYLATFFILAAGVLWHSYKTASTPILRQQMKWVTRGTILAIAPFTLFYVIPYLHGTAPTTGMKVSVLSLIFLPLTFGYAIVRYRLMDVDLIFKRGMAYTIATASIVGMYFGTVALVGAAVQKTVPNTGPAGLIVAITITALLFDPVKNWIQQHLDKFFYRKRYDYRRTLVAFGRDLNSETDLNKMFDLVVERLSQTLFVARLAIFTAASDDSGGFHLAKSYGITWAEQLDLSFLTAERPEL